MKDSSILKFERNYALLDVCVEKIKGSFKHVLNKHEQDFIRAYQVISKLFIFLYRITWIKCKKN